MLKEDREICNSIGRQRKTPKGEGDSQLLDSQRDPTRAEGNAGLNGANVTAFQRTFFEQLSSVEASTKKEFVERASRRGVPREAAAAFWRMQFHTSEPP